MKKIEELSPITYTDALNKRKNELERLIKLKKAFLERTKNLENAGHIRIVPHYNKLQFYLITKKGDTLGKYIPIKQNNFAISLIKYDYTKKCLPAMQKELSQIKKLLKFTKKNSVESIFKKFSPSRKSILEPLTMTNEQYAKIWQEIPYASNPFNYEQNDFYTSKGEHVRSKSEVIIANVLAKNNIPYKYEYPLDLKNKSFPVFPDFCCLNLNNRQEVFWEHFGMMDDAEYAAKAVSKIQEYALNDFHNGINIIFTFETSTSPLNIRALEHIISQMF